MAGKADQEKVIKKSLLLLYISVIGFLLNLMWENVQAPLFAGYEGFWQHFSTCLWATVVDVLIIISFWALFASYYKDPFWIKNISWKEILVLLFLGGAVAIGFEQVAIAAEMWSYTNDMPVVPFLATGLSPLLQMMLLPILTFWLSSRLHNLSCTSLAKKQKGI